MDVLIEVPTEDPGSKLHGVLAKVVGTLCGTRDAPMTLRVPMHGPSRDKQVSTVTAHVDDLFVVWCLKDVQDVYHDLADAFEMNMHICWTKDGKQ